MIYHYKLINEELSVIPTTFTSNDSVPGYVCSASTFNSSDPPWKIWKRDYTTSEWTWWTGPNISYPCWIQIEVPEAFVPSAFTICNEVSSPANLKSAIFQGSNDGSTWTDLYAITDWPNTAGYKNKMEVSTQTSFKYFRLYITETSAGSNGVSIQAMEIFKKEYSSEGFNSWGRTIKYRSAQLAGCEMQNLDKGLVFYAPLSQYSNTAITGQSLSYAGGADFTTFNGVPAIHVHSGCVYTGALAENNLDDGFTISLWISAYFFRFGSGIIAHIGQWDGTEGQWAGIVTNNGAAQLYYETVGSGANANLQTETWYHLVYQQGNNIARAYINGVLDIEKPLSYKATACSGKSLYLGSKNGNPYEIVFDGLLAGVRLYNRILSYGEIVALSKEFTPTV